MTKPAPSLPLFGSDCPPVASTTADACRSPSGVHDPESFRRPLEIDDAVTRQQRRADRRGLAQQSVEHIARAIRVREQFAVRFFVERDANLAEEGRRGVDRESAQHAPDDRGAAAPEVAIA